ncbi:MAG TPA: SH3 domain-containing protein [Desulfomonilaceae bacterium]|nr:SH3 domain-containing protein [Desulfomonilaceae bacterium]
MAFQFLVILLQCAALAAFLILWYFWVKRKMETSFLLEEESHVLFPFKYFSWVLMGLIFLTCLVQIHFIRVSSSVHERMASMVGYYKKHEQHAASMNDMKGAIDRLRSDMELNFKNLRAQQVDSLPFKCPEAPVASDTRSQGKGPLVTIQPPKTDTPGFAKEAKAASTPKMGPSARPHMRQPKQEEGESVYSMPLSRTGRAVVDNLRVRQRPHQDAVVVDKLTPGQSVKVTEKRLIHETVWFRVVTPSGRAGWVDYRYLKLEGSV